MRIEHIIKPTILSLVVSAVLFLFAPPSAFAYVTGRCDGCHTMHNSEENAPVAQFYDQATLALTTTASGTPGLASLLRKDCVVCHTNPSGGAPTYTLNGDTVPVVFTTTPPSGVTAGGNFFYTVGGTIAADNTGHNVRGIADEDITLKRAPGAGSVGCANSCHDSLTFTDAGTTPTDGTNIQTNGCQGCHIYPGHHARSDAEDASAPEFGPGNTYRFLSGHDPGIVGVVWNGGGGYEDPDWETDYNPGPGGLLHNIYAAQTANPEKHPKISIGRWCAGCHADFHAYGLVEELTGLSGGGDRDATAGGNPWLRHPTNVKLPPDTDSGNDWDWVDALTVPYNTDYPVARQNVTRYVPYSGTDQVMCLSCHKAHASEHPNSLRWAYNASDSDAHSGANRTTGCFFCHRAKDN